MCTGFQSTHQICSIKGSCHCDVIKVIRLLSVATCMGNVDFSFAATVSE